MGALPSGGRSGNVATVAARSDVGPREVNEDRLLTALSANDGSWVIAVADGLGGHPRGAEAAVAALPPRIASKVDMAQAFVAAHRAVAALAPSPTYWRFSPHRCPMATLCVAGWTPDGGLIVAHMGDTLPVLVSQPSPGDSEGRVLGPVHRGLFGRLTSCLGVDVPRTEPQRGGADFNLVAVRDDLLAPHDGEWAIAVASDGVWEKLVSDPDDADTWGVDELAGRVVDLIGPAGGPAGRIAEELLAAARDRGLDDNATVAVAHMTPSGGRNAREALRVRLEQREPTTLVGSGGMPPAAESTPRMVQRPGTEGLGFGEEGSRIVAEFTRGPEFALLLEELDREDAARELGFAFD